MYSPHPPVSALGNSVMDGSGTINPAALDSSVGIPSASSTKDIDASPRGVKRSRTPDGPDGANPADTLEDDDSKPRKRGRAPKPNGAESPVSSTPTATQTTPAPLQTPQLKAQSLPQASPNQVSPPKSTPTASKVKALPTVRDHTTDQLNEAGDEYIPREWDEEGDKKVEDTGHLRDGREYRCRVFLVPNRGNKLFMLATECARVLNYRDSYLLFNKNRSLFKIIASQTEKDDLIHQDILPYSYRSRQIAIVTAKSMFRQFGSRLIVNGRRVRDDYWEAKARKQGFTEEDHAGEKRPGATKQREEAAAQASSTNTTAINTLAHGEIVYRNGPGLNDHVLRANSLGIGGIAPASGATIPMILADDPRTREYGNVQRPRQDIVGTTPFQDRSQPSASTEIIGHAAQSMEFNKALGQQRKTRSLYYEDHWKREHPPVRAPEQQQVGSEADDTPQIPQSFQSPPSRTGQSLSGMPQQQLLAAQQHGQHQVMNAQAFAQHQQQQQSNIGQSPMRSNLHQQMQAGQIQPRNPSMSFQPGGPSQSPQYAFPPPNQQMWPLPQAQSPHPPAQHGMQQFAHHPQQGSPIAQHSPHHMQTSLAHQQGTGNMQQMYQNMAGMNPAMYQNMSRNVFQGSPNSAQQFMHQSGAGQQPGMQGWTQPPNNPGWHTF